MKNLTEKQVLLLRPEFKLNPKGMSIIEWFEVQGGDNFYCIRSGLSHADGVTKSPYYYDKVVIGKGAKKESLKLFNTWWNDILLGGGLS